MSLLWGILPRRMVLTMAFGRFCRLTLDELGREWGEAEWTASDLWR